MSSSFYQEGISANVVVCGASHALSADAPIVDAVVVELVLVVAGELVVETLMTPGKKPLYGVL